MNTPTPPPPEPTSGRRDPGREETRASESPFVPQPPKPRRWLRAIGLGVAFLLTFVLGMVAAQDGVPETPTAVADTEAADAPSEDAAPAYTPPPPPEPDYGEPTSADFTLTVYETERQCFGEAGCNVTFTVDLTNVTGITLDPSKTYELRYEISGAEDQYLATLELQDDEYTSDEAFVSVAREGDELTAAVLDVRER